MHRTRLDSTAIAAVDYEPSTALLQLEFTSGEVYRYFAVPPSVHRGLLDAPSAGRYFQQCIRDRYPSELRR